MRREMKHEFVAVVQEPFTVDRLVVADGQVLRESGACAGKGLLDRNRLDPVNRILQLQMGTCRLRNVERRPWVGGLAADVEEQ